MLFSVNRRYQWSVGFGNPSWQLTPQSVYPISFSIDGSQPINARAMAITKNTVEVPLADNVQLFDRFKLGDMLRVSAANQNFQFQLTDTAKLLPGLLQCVRESLEAETRTASTPSTNPFAPTPAPAPAGDTNRAEATMIAANLMSLSGLKGFRILSKEESSSIKADAVWRAGNALGTVRILPASATGSVKNFSGLLIGSDAKTCKGTFASGAIPAETDDSIVRVFTSCKTGDRTLTIYYLALARKQGGYYLFSTASSGSEQPAKEADASIRQAVLNAIPR
jgi:hypothetical protein